MLSWQAPPVTAPYEVADPNCVRAPYVASANDRVPRERAAHLTHPAKRNLSQATEQEKRICGSEGFGDVLTLKPLVIPPYRRNVLGRQLPSHLDRVPSAVECQAGDRKEYDHQENQSDDEAFLHVGHASNDLPQRCRAK